MMVNADIFVRDVPGQLVGSLEPISLVDGNIVGVVHNRENIVNGRIAVNLTFEVGSAENLEKLKNIWKSRDVMISRISSVIETFPMEYLLIGDIGASQIERLIENAGKVVGLESVDVRFSSKISSKERTAMISAKVRSEDDLEKLNAFMMTACKRAKIVYIRGVGQ
ncbi:MAG: homoserine dehydrogenase [Methanomassiliicoccaceae archaeon]|jgi:ACT domain-containing protein|nr:homoserine dehydrogenase [Methanomassiliicoccaceae archaeon]